MARCPGIHASDAVIGHTHVRPRLTKLSGAALSAPAQSLAAFGDLLAAQNSNHVQLFNASNPSALTLICGGGPEGCLGFNLENADGTADRGLWLPLGDYGVDKVNVSKNSSAQ